MTRLPAISASMSFIAMISLDFAPRRASRSSIALLEVDTPSRSCSHWRFSTSVVDSSGMSMLGMTSGIASAIISNIDVCCELWRSDSLCASARMRSMTCSMPFRSPNRSNAPALIRLSIAFLPTPASSGDWHICSMDSKAPSFLRALTRGATAAAPTFLIVDSPKRMDAPLSGLPSMEYSTSL